ERILFSQEMEERNEYRAKISSSIVEARGRPPRRLAEQRERVPRRGVHDNVSGSFVRRTPRSHWTTRSHAISGGAFGSGKRTASCPLLVGRCGSSLHCG